MEKFHISMSFSPKDGRRKHYSECVASYTVPNKDEAFKVANILDATFYCDDNGRFIDLDKDTFWGVEGDTYVDKIYNEEEWSKAMSLRSLCMMPW